MKKDRLPKTVNGHGYIFKTLWLVLFASAICTNRKVHGDSRTAAQGVQPFVRLAERTIQGLPLYRSAPF